MKHRIKSDGHIRAWCKNPGCMVGLEGGMVGDMSRTELNKFFSSDCPAVFSSQKKDIATAPFEERVEYLIFYAKKEMESWKKLITFWKKTINTK